MDELEVVNRFDRQRPQLRAVAYRILGSSGLGSGERRALRDSGALTI
jgi:hypothetical protein